MHSHNYEFRKHHPDKHKISENSWGTRENKASSVTCKLDERGEVWSKMNEVVQSIPRGERVVTGTDFSGHVSELNRGDEKVLDRHYFKEEELGWTDGGVFCIKKGNGCGEEKGGT